MIKYYVSFIALFLTHFGLFATVFKGDSGFFSTHGKVFGMLGLV
jgi:hypothetical protein